MDDFLAMVWNAAENYNDGCEVYQVKTPRKLLRDAADIGPDEIGNLDTDETKAVRYIVELADKYGWDKTLYRADYLTGNNLDIAEAYSETPINKTDALLAFFTGWMKGTVIQRGI